MNSQINASTSFKRFANASDADIAKIREDRHATRTKNATKWATNVFQDWYDEKLSCGECHSAVWQTLPKDNLNKVLAKFYVEVRRQDGLPYSKTGLASLCAGLQRHLSNEPWSVNYVLVGDLAFKESNDTMAGINKLLSRQGLDVVKHHDPIETQDIEKLKSTGVISTDNPLALQRLVWLSIALHFGRRGREGYRQMTTRTFTVKPDSTGRRYLEHSFCETTKNHQGDTAGNSYMPQGRMYEQPGDELCPIRAYELYISLLNGDVDCLWQKPNTLFRRTGNWYNRQPLGQNTLGDILKNMCKDAGITTKYTNHCTRVTTSVLLNDAGFGESDIINVTGHKSTTSLTNYIHKASKVKKQKMADTISNALSKSNTNPSHDISVIASSSSSSTSQLPVPAIPENVSTILGHPLPIDDNNTPELNDKDINNYMQFFEKNNAHKGIFQNCTINNPVFNITIQK